MVLRPKLGGDSIYTLRHGLPQAKAYFLTTRMTPHLRCLHPQWQPNQDREFDSDVFHFLILIKACLKLLAHTFTWFFCPLPWQVMWTQRKCVLGVATQFLQWSRNRIYSVLLRKDLLILLPEIWVWSEGTVRGRC